MGQAKARLIEAGKTAEVYLDGPEFLICAEDRAQLARDPDGGTSDQNVRRRAFRHIATQVISAAFPNGLDRRDGAMWAAWLEVLDEASDSPATVSMGQVEWLRRHAADDALRVLAPLAQWREALVEYLQSVHSGETSA